MKEEITEKIFEDWYCRLVEERDALQEKLEKLENFLKQSEEEILFKISQDQFFLLKLQKNAMENYLFILNKRLEVSK